jgi:hypothetical protein
MFLMVDQIRFILCQFQPSLIFASQAKVYPQVPSKPFRTRLTFTEGLELLDQALVVGHG